MLFRSHPTMQAVSVDVLVPSTSTDTACIVGCGVILPKESSSTVVFKGLGITVTHGSAKVVPSFLGVLIGNEKEACSASE